MLIEYKYDLDANYEGDTKNEVTYIEHINSLLYHINSQSQIIELLVINGVYIEGAERIETNIHDKSMWLYIKDMYDNTIASIVLEICKTKVKCTGAGNVFSIKVA